MDKMREEFEAWAKNEGYYIDTIDDYLTAEIDGLPAGSYRSYEARVSWQAWKASREAILVDLPAGLAESQFHKISEQIEGFGGSWS